MPAETDALRLLIATGGSPHSRMAIAYGANLAAALHGSVTLLCVTDDRDTKDCQEVFQAAAPELLPINEVRAVVRRGHPAEEVLLESEESEYDMVVLGEKGHHTSLTRFLIGPTAERVASRAHIPVLVVKGDPGDVHRPVGRILVAMGLRRRFSEVDRILRRATTLARANNAEVTLLHVMSQMPIPPAGTPEDWEATAAELIEMETAEGQFMDYGVSQLRSAGVIAEALVRHGLVVDEVLAETEEGDYDLLIIGGHEPGSWLENLVLENVALQILHRSRVAVLTVHG